MHQTNADIHLPSFQQNLGLLETFFKPFHSSNQSDEAKASVETRLAMTGRLLSFWDDIFVCNHPFTESMTVNPKMRDSNIAITSASLETTASSLPPYPQDLTVLIVSHQGCISAVLTALQQLRHVKSNIERTGEMDRGTLSIPHCSISEIAMTKCSAAAGHSTTEWTGLLHQ